MARQILVLDSSASMRKIIHTMIIANINDAKVDEVGAYKEAIERIDGKDYQLVIFSRESSDPDWLDFIKKAKMNPERKQLQFLIFSSTKQREYIEEAEAAGVADHFFIPCSSDALAGLVNKLCSPFSLRAAKRFYVPSTTATIEQGDSCRIQAEVINFSEGGIFCEADFNKEYNWGAPAMITMNFTLDDEGVTATGFYSATSRVIVKDSNPDFTPKTIRIAYRFLTVPEETRHKLDKVFTFAERLQEMKVQ